MTRRVKVIPRGSVTIASGQGASLKLVRILESPAQR